MGEITGTTIAFIALGSLIGVIVLVVIVYLLITRSEKKKLEKQQVEAEKYLSGSLEVPVTSMDQFMEFDEVKDNMIIRKNRTQYVMVIQCQGVNYDLLSEDEKLAVEEGFIQFLNTLRFPIQLYVQTRTLNFKDIIEEYKGRMNEKKDEIDKLRMKLEQVKLTGNLDQIEKLEFEIRRRENVFEYGMDISDYISRMSVNSNILQQKTYVVISYYAAELQQAGNVSKEELDNRCFSELYTRCQSVIRALASSEVLGKILSSEELAELLYVAYNRDDSENLQLTKVLDAEYDSLYNKGKDVLLKKQEKLDEQIQLDAIDLATDSILEADRKRREEEELRRMQIQEKALDLLDQYKGQMEPELYEGAKKEVKRRIVRKKKQDEAAMAQQTVAQAKPQTTAQPAFQATEAELASQVSSGGLQVDENGNIVQQVVETEMVAKQPAKRGRKPKSASM